jgi:hypothetical protein
LGVGQTPSLDQANGQTSKYCDVIAPERCPGLSLSRYVTPPEVCLAKYK